MAVEVDRAVGAPQQLDHREGFLETADRTREVEAVGQRVFALAAAQPEDEAPLGQVVDGQRRLREQRGVAADRVDHGADQGDPLGQNGGRGGHGQSVEMTVR